MLNRLFNTLSAVCPVVGVGPLSPNTTAGPGNARIDYASAATDPQRTAAQAALAAFDWSQAAHDAWLEDQHPERKAIRQAAANAIAGNDTFLAIATPTNAQNAAQLRRVTEQINRIIPRLIQID